MDKITSFVEFLLVKEGARTTSSKTGLYPLGYGGIGLYPDADYLTHAADAVYYLTHDKRLYHNGDNPPFDIRHLPCDHDNWGDHANNGDNAPHDITHIHGKIVPPKDTTLAGTVVSFKNFVTLVMEPKTISPPDSPNLPD